MNNPLEEFNKTVADCRSMSRSLTRSDGGQVTIGLAILALAQAVAMLSQSPAQPTTDNQPNP